MAWTSARVAGLENASGLSDLLDIDDGSLRRIESGRTNPTTVTLLRISIALEVEIKDLFDIKIHPK